VQIAQTWVNARDRQVAFILARGKVTIMMWPVPDDRKDVIAYFTNIINDHLSKDHIGRVGSLPVLIVEQHSDVKHTNPAWIEFYKNGIDINIYSTSYPSTALLGLADALR
jgi:hypothetical protein